jgi:hypothetical protein
MPTAGKPVVSSAVADKPLPIANFKNSLHAWLVRWKVERTNKAKVLAKPPDEPAPG